MKQGIFVAIMCLLAVLGFVSFFGLIFSFDPFVTGAGIITLTYLTLFFGLTGLFSLIIFGIKKRMYKEWNTEKIFWTGAILSLVIVGGLAILANV
jgi:hypothetical protein